MIDRWRSLAGGILWAEFVPGWVATWDSIAWQVRVQGLDGRHVVLPFRGSPYLVLEQWAVALERGDEEALALLAPGPPWLWPCEPAPTGRCTTDRSGETCGEQRRRADPVRCAGGSLAACPTSCATARTW